RMKGEPQETLLAAADDDVAPRAADVQERGRQQSAAAEDPDQPALLHDEQPARAVAGVGDADRSGEAAGDDWDGGDEGAGKRGGWPSGGQRSEKEETAGPENGGALVFHEVDA